MDEFILFNALLQRVQNDTDLVNQERITLYKDFMSCLYKLKAEPFLLFYDNETKNTLNDIIPSLRLVSSRKLTKYFDKFFDTIKSKVDEYAEKEAQINPPSDEYGSESDWQYYDFLIEKLRKETALKPEYFDEQIEYFADKVQKELHIK